jgi:hypothetical protein
VVSLWWFGGGIVVLVCTIFGCENFPRFRDLFFGCVAVAPAPCRFVRNEKDNCERRGRDGKCASLTRRRAKDSLGWRVTSHPSQNAQWMGHLGKRKAKADPPPAAKDDNQKTKAIGEKSWRSRGGQLEFVEGFGVGVEDLVG